MTNIIIMIAVVVMAIAIIIMSVKVRLTEESVGDFDWDEYNKKMDELDRELDQNRNNIDNWQAEMNSIIERMDNVANDIARLDEKAATDHNNLVDIRSRYVLYREPIQEEDNG